jgi:hypothetical protein
MALATRLAFRLLDARVPSAQAPSRRRPAPSTVPATN